MQIKRVRLLATLFSVSLSYRYLCFFFFIFFFSVWSLVFNTVFPFGLFSFLVMHLDILSLSLEFYFGKGISKALDPHTGQAYDQKRTISCQDISSRPQSLPSAVFRSIG